MERQELASFILFFDRFFVRCMIVALRCGERDRCDDRECYLHARVANYQSGSRAVNMMQGGQSAWGMRGDLRTSIGKYF